MGLIERPGGRTTNIYSSLANLQAGIIETYESCICLFIFSLHCARVLSFEWEVQKVRLREGRRSVCLAVVSTMITLLCPLHLPVGADDTSH
jgi:hypothetical protein